MWVYLIIMLRLLTALALVPKFRNFSFLRLVFSALSISSSKDTKMLKTQITKVNVQKIKPRNTGKFMVQEPLFFWEIFRDVWWRKELSSTWGILCPTFRLSLWKPQLYDGPSWLSGGTTFVLLTAMTKTTKLFLCK